MPLTRAEAIDASFPQASDIRKHNAGIFPREGIFPDPTTIAAAGVAYAGSGWAVGARAFVAELKRGGAPYTQSYGNARVSNDSNVASAWTISAAPASGARIDLLCIRARDTTQGDSSSGAPTDGPSGAARTGFPEFLVVTGTAGTTPARPALPAGYFEVAQIQTPSGAASTAGSTITQTYPFAHVVGGDIYVRTAAERDALTNVLPQDVVNVLTGAGAGRYIRSLAGTWLSEYRDLTTVATVGGLAGPAAPAGTATIRQQGVATINLGSNGDGTIPFPTPMPTGLISATLERYDFTTYGPTFQILNVTQDLNGINFRVYTNAGTNPGALTNIKFAWSAIGY